MKRIIRDTVGNSGKHQIRKGLGPYPKLTTSLVALSRDWDEITAVERRVITLDRPRPFLAKPTSFCVCPALDPNIESRQEFLASLRPAGSVACRTMVEELRRKDLP
jgi:hypothetical protein